MVKLLRQHWLVALCAASMVALVWVGAPAWAAPVLQGGTVPNPTPTSDSGPIATATPRPDDDDDDDASAPDSGGNVQVDPNNPNIIFDNNTPAAPAAPALTARVTVNGLNVREGPGTAFNTLGTIPANTQVTVLSRNEDNTWWYICCIPNTETRGWVSAQLLTPDFDAAQATTLLSIFGETPPAAATPVPQETAPALTQAELPLEVGFQIDPYFVWQGITATLTISVNNPNTIDAVNVLLSDELPASLTLVAADVDAGGTVETVTATSGNPLLLFRWPTLPADTAATATIVVLVGADLPNGAVIDNLVATRARNVPYSTEAVTIGLPPVVPPDFQ